LIMFFLVYALIAVVGGSILLKMIKKGPDEVTPSKE
jgi:cytochrome bd-type quinol oxidase subunit 1